MIIIVLIKNILLIKAKQKEHEIYRLEHNIDENYCLSLL